MGRTKDSVWAPTEDLGPRNEELKSLLEPFASGQRVGRYRILRKLGEGGMGQVYLADDSNLGRRVALKVLRTEYRRHWRRLQRFKREAKAIAALSHPNIVTLYADETVDNVYFLVMEYVSGKKLTDLIPKGGVSLDRLFDIGIQLTDALAAAHARGITHRDLKPSNIVIGKDNNLKVLDFGLAKLREPEPEEGDSTASTELLTKEGGLLGTVPYMSPEQVQGKPADERSDLFSCGVILYQLAIGQRPFDGDTSADLMSSIIRDDPPSVDTKKVGLPHHLSRIIKRALEKDPEHRYQSAKDLRNSLADLRQELSEGDPDTPSTHRSRPRLLKLVISLAALAAVSIGVLAWRMIDGPSGTVTPDRPPLPQARSFQVTSAPGWESDVAISPDGTLLAYASNGWGNSDIWLVDAQGGTPIQLTNHPSSDSKPAWFPDNTAIAFQSERGGQTAIWKVPRLGGSPTMLLADASDPAISPDGTRIAFSRITPGGNSRIATAEISNPDSVSTLTGSDDGMWGHRDPAWSPDGQQLCYTDFGDLWIVPSVGGEARKLTAAGAVDREPVWSPGGRFVYFSSYREGPLALWRVEVSTGETERITMGTGPESQPSISSDGSRLAYSTFHQDPDVVLRDLDSDDEAHIPGTRSEWGPAVAPDRGAVVYVSNRDGHDSLWRQDLEGLNALGQAVRLSDEDAEPSNPDFSPDGRWIAYQRKVESTRNIWTLLAESGLPRPFTEGEGVRYQPAWSPDGSRIAYIADDDGRAGLWVMPFEDGRSTGPARRIEIGVEALWWPRWSPDGTRIAYVGAEDAVWDVWISLADNSEPPKRLTHGAHANYLRWGDTGNGLLVSGRWDGRVLSLRRVDPNTGKSSPFEPPLDFGLALDGVFDIGATGTLLAFTRETVRGDLWLLETHEGAY